MKKEKLLDIIKKKFSLSEKESTGLILSGKVLVDGKPSTKIGIKINPQEDIRIKQFKKYVSRGSYKLLTAFDIFDVDVTNKICIDIGSSTGGFTQVLLEKGAKKIYAVDCGKNLLDFSLRQDNRVVLFENKVVSSLNKNEFKEQIDLAVMDVSFTSSIHIIKYIKSEFNIKEMIILIKPQFEWERLKSILTLKEEFNGIIKDEIERTKIIDYIKNEISEIGFKVMGITPSKIKGIKGNVEYLFHIIII